MFIEDYYIFFVGFRHYDPRCTRFRNLILNKKKVKNNLKNIISLELCIYFPFGEGKTHN